MIISDKARVTVARYGQAITALHQLGFDPFDIAESLHLRGAEDVVFLARLARRLETS